MQFLVLQAVKEAVHFINYTCTIRATVWSGLGAAIGALAD